MGTMGAVVAVVAGVGGYLALQPRDAVPEPAAPSPIPAATPAAPRTEITTPEVIATPQVTAPQMGKPIVIGMNVAVTGLFAGDGLAAINAENQAAEEWEAIWGGLLGGREWRYVNIDNAAKNTEQAVATIRRLVTLENVDVIVTDYPTVDATEYPEVALHDIFYINHDTSGLSEQQVLASGWNSFDGKAGGPDTIPAWPDYKFWGTFQGVPYDTDYSKNAIMHLNTHFQGKGDQGGWTPINKKYAIIDTAGPYSQRISHTLGVILDAQGWTKVFQEIVPYGTVEYSTVLEKIRADPPALIYNTDFIPSDAAAFYKQFQEDPTPSVIHQQYGPSLPEFLELAGDAALGLFWYECRGIVEDPHGLAYIERIWDRWNSPPALANSAQQYDMARVTLMLGHFSAWSNPDSPWRGDGGRRVSAILNSGCNWFHSDFKTREIGADWCMRPGQTNRPWPLDASSNSGSMSLGGPIVSYQIKLGKNPHGPGYSKDVGQPGNKPVHVLAHAGKVDTFFHDRTDTPFQETFPKDDPGFIRTGQSTAMGQAVMAEDPVLFHIGGTFPFDADGKKPKWAHGVFELPPWFEDVSPAIMRRVSKY